jgi:hypothetical protein
MTSSRHCRAARRRRWLPVIVLVLFMAVSSACGGGGGSSDQGQGGAGGGGPEEEAGEPPPSDDENAGANGPEEEDGNPEPTDDGDAGANGPVEPSATPGPSDDRCGSIVSASDRAVAALDDLLERPDAGPEARNAAAEVLEQSQSEIATQLEAVTSEAVIDAGQRMSDALATAVEHVRAGEPAPAEELVAAGRSLESACGAG